MATETLRYAHTDLDDDLRKEGRLLSIGSVECGLSDQQGNIVAATIDVSVIDIPDRPIGTRLTMDGGDATPETGPISKFFLRDELNILCLSDQGRAQGLLPRNIGRALILDTTYGSPVTAKLSGTDPFFCDSGAFGPDKNFPTYVYPDFYQNAPADIYKKVMPVIMGEVSDEGAIDPVTGLGSSKGLCPCTFVGMDNLGTGVGGGSEQWGRFNVCLFAVYAIIGFYASNLQGGLYGTGSASSDGANPSTISLPGDTDLSTVLVNSTTITLFTAKGIVKAVIEAVDGTSVTIHSQVAVADATNIDWIIGDSPSTRVKIDVDARQGTDVMIPTYPGYIRPTPYEDITDSAGVTYRVTDLWIRGPLLDDALAGTVSLAVNVVGIEDKGDGSGLPIIDFYTAYDWWLENCVLVNSSKPMVNGLYPQTEADLVTMGNVFADGTNKVQGSTFVAAQALSATKLAGYHSGIAGYQGYQISGYWGSGGNGTPMRDAIQLWNDNGGCRLGINEWGQIFVFLLDPFADPSEWPVVDHVQRVFGNVTRTNPYIEMENSVQGQCDWDPDAQKYRQPVSTIPSADGILHNKGITKLSKLIDFKLTNNRAQMNDALSTRLDLTKNGPVYVSFTGDPGLWDYPVGTGILFNSIMGPGLTGYFHQPLIILQKTFNIGTHLVDMMCLDVGPGSGLGLLVNVSEQFILTDDPVGPIFSDVPSEAIVLV